MNILTVLLLVDFRPYIGHEATQHATDLDIAFVISSSESAHVHMVCIDKVFTLSSNIQTRRRIVNYLAKSYFSSGWKGGGEAKNLFR